MDRPRPSHRPPPTARLDDAARAAEVGAGRLGDTAHAVELDAFTWSWRLTRLGVGLLCLALTVAVVLLIGGRGPAPPRRTSRPVQGG
ncbi:hypothetical protein [Streptomyces sp. NRRL F-7442]|uniref:hypothetical protein n=1 Tax=Streptomyces sp. NRRL F-7442 TaxID=1519498 RepID=UPI0006AE2D54|nr:hypothetical protein [Streptomyces sp. NRRL F-7442]KOX51784.1 hypothetical protein ADL09_04065 [Streptomyces sp. NRRL F-7442]